MADINIDNRRINYLRVCLYQDDQGENPATLGHFTRTASKILNVSNFPESELYQLLKEVMVDNPATANDDTLINLARFSLLIDLYHYFPTLKKQDKNSSNDIYYILSSNKRGQLF